MHSCSDKRELVRSCAAQHTFLVQPPKKDSSMLLFGLGNGREGEERRSISFNSWVLQGLW